METGEGTPTEPAVVFVDIPAMERQLDELREDNARLRIENQAHVSLRERVEALARDYKERAEGPPGLGYPAVPTIVRAARDIAALLEAPK